MDVWDSGEDQGGVDLLIDRFTIIIPVTVSNGADESNSLTVQGQHGTGDLTLAYFNMTIDPIASSSSANVNIFSTSSQGDYGKSCDYNKLIPLYWNTRVQYIQIYMCDILYEGRVVIEKCTNPRNVDLATGGVRNRAK